MYAVKFLCSLLWYTKHHVLVQIIIFWSFIEIGDARVQNCVGNWWPKCKISFDIDGLYSNEKCLIDVFLQLTNFLLSLLVTNAVNINIFDA